MENPRHGGAGWAAVYGVAQSRTRLKWQQQKRTSTGLSHHLTGSYGSCYPDFQAQRLSEQMDYRKGKQKQWPNARPSLVTQTVKCLPAMRETLVRSLGWEDPLEEGMEAHCSVLAWRIPWTEGYSPLGHKEWLSDFKTSLEYQACSHPFQAGSTQSGSTKSPCSQVQENSRVCSKPFLGRADTVGVHPWSLLSGAKLTHQSARTKDKGREAEDSRLKTTTKKFFFSKQRLQRPFYISFKETSEFKWQCQSFPFSSMTGLVYP